MNMLSNFYIIFGLALALTELHVALKDKSIK